MMDKFAKTSQDYKRQWACLALITCTIFSVAIGAAYWIHDVPAINVPITKLSPPWQILLGVLNVCLLVVGFLLGGGFSANRDSYEEVEYLHLELETEQSVTNDPVNVEHNPPFEPKRNRFAFYFNIKHAPKHELVQEVVPAPRDRLLRWLLVCVVILGAIACVTHQIKYAWSLGNAVRDHILAFMIVPTCIALFLTLVISIILRSPSRSFGKETHLVSKWSTAAFISSVIGVMVMNPLSTPLYLPWNLIFISTWAVILCITVTCAASLFFVFSSTSVVPYLAWFTVAISGVCSGLSLYGSFKSMPSVCSNNASLISLLTAIFLYTIRFVLKEWQNHPANDKSKRHPEYVKILLKMPYTFTRNQFIDVALDQQTGKRYFDDMLAGHLIGPDEQSQFKVTPLGLSEIIQYRDRKNKASSGTPIQDNKSKWP